MSKKPQLVPFGKYKGQPVEVLAQDEQYCRWLANQDWFRTQFVGIHTLIVNNFTEASVTPEHNALQARFLDPAWCQQFVFAYGTVPNIEAYKQHYRNTVQNYLNVSKKNIAHHDKDYEEQLKHEVPAVTLDYYYRRAQHARALLKDADSFTAHLDRQITEAEWLFRQTCTFEEHGVDVKLHARVTTTEIFPFFETQGQGDWATASPITQKSRWEWDQFYVVECKPLVGDDYPAVLRQMKNITEYGARVLLAGEVRSSVVSLDQIRQIFSSADIKIITVADVLSQSIRWATSKGA